MYKHSNNIYKLVYTNLRGNSQHRKRETQKEKEREIVAVK